MLKSRNQYGWLSCDRGVCLYRDDRAGDRCIKHGALLTYVTEYTGMTEKEARRRWAKARRCLTNV